MFSNFGMSVCLFVLVCVTEVVQEVLTFVSEEARTLAKEFFDEMAIELQVYQLM